MDTNAYIKKIEECIAKGPYKDDWASLSKHQTPSWFTNAKFGIFIHWGIYSVPAFANEWYSRNMYIQGTAEFEHHRKTYGEHKEFGYKDFIPMFTAEHFDADEWVELFKQSGAQYVIPVAEHHDGFQMYQSDLSIWNAYNMGPKRDVIGQLCEAAKKKGLEFGTSTHRIEHWFFMGHGKEFESDITDDEQIGDFYWPAMPEADHFDINSKPTPTEEFLTDWMVRTCEIIDRYPIKELYFDWWIQHRSAKPYLKKIAAYYYNRAAERGHEVLIAYKHDAFMFGTAVVDIERGQFSEAKTFAWQTDTSMAKNSWCYTPTNDYKKAGDILRDLVDIVSKNGCMLLNVGPKADGTIAQEEKDLLRKIGEWLKINGECIYNSTPWRIATEGPTLVQEGQFTDGTDKEFTSKDFRFTTNKDSIYAICMAMEKEQTISIKAFGTGEGSQFHGIIDEVRILGCDQPISYIRTDRGLLIQPNGFWSENPVVIKIKVN